MNRSESPPGEGEPSISHTLSLIHQIEHRKKYLHYVGIVFTFWLVIFVPIGLQYLSFQPDAPTGIFVNDIGVRLKSGMLRSEKVALAAIPTRMDDRMAAYAHGYIDGEGSPLDLFQENKLGLNPFGMMMFYFAGFVVILFALRLIKTYRIS